MYDIETDQWSNDIKIEEGVRAKGWIGEAYRRLRRFYKHGD